MAAFSRSEAISGGKRLLSRGFGYDFGPRIYPREGPQRSVLLFDVFSRPHLGEDCCSVARVAVSRRCRSGSFPCSPQFFLLCSPSFIDRDSVPVLSLTSVSSLMSSWILSSLVTEREFCWTIVTVTLSQFPSMWAGWLWFSDLALVVWLCRFFSYSPLAVGLLCVGSAVVFRGGVDVVCSVCAVVFHRAPSTSSWCVWCW